MMSDDFRSIVLAIAGPLTQRTLENLRRTLEDLWIKSTAQDADPTSFTPELIAQAHEAAKHDNARTIASWALAIYIECNHADPQMAAIQKVQGYLATEKDKLAFCEHDPDGTPEVLQAIKNNILSLEKDLRDLQQPAPPILGHPPQERSPWGEPTGHYDLDGLLQAMSPKNP